jgi:hypothetical protein
LFVPADSTDDVIYLNNKAKVMMKSNNGVMT